ncbi:AAA family ATPase, partial [Methanoregula sp.]|uniref:AAA family ATPase n=1 Tax=Methanoregula sp. TaxID=2052170 RepID=UPI0025FD8DAF
LHHTRPVNHPVATANVSGTSFRKSVQKSGTLRVGLCGDARHGKTFTSLWIGFGIGGPIAVMATENSSAEFYAQMGEYDVCVLQAPFTAQKYTDAIHAAERAWYNVIIIDSLSHAWAGEGGLLDLKDNIAKTSKSGNSFTAWKDVTPLHRGLVDAMLQSPCHIIATMRSKTEYVIDTDDRGRSFPRKIGMAPVQREGMDYEFTLVFDIDAAHIATASKDRTSLFTGKSFQPSAETGRQLKEWLETDTSAGGA